MRSTVRKEETMPDFMYGVCVNAEGTRSGGERLPPIYKRQELCVFSGPVIAAHLSFL